MDREEFMRELEDMFQDEPDNNKLNVVLDWFANTNHTGFLLAEKRGYFAEAGLEVHIDGEVHGVMDLGAGGRERC